MVRHILLFPLLITLFTLDRVFLVLVCWKTSYKFDRWIYKDELILESIYRVLIGLSSIIVILLSFSLW